MSRLEVSTNSEAGGIYVYGTTAEVTSVYPARELVCCSLI